jgi:hypothetical protein
MPLLLTAQVDAITKIVDLAKIYKDFMFRNSPTEVALTNAKAGLPKELKVTANFIFESVKTNNSLLDEKWLTVPDEASLKNIYIISELFDNMRKENSIDNNWLTDSLMKADLSRYELIDNYYGMLFTSVGNKNQPFDMSKTNINLSNCNLKDDTEKGILYLRACPCAAALYGVS